MRNERSLAVRGDGTNGTYGTHVTYGTGRRPTNHFSHLTSGAYATNVHLNGGDAFSAGDFFAGVTVESQEAENR